ncbi:MAG: hypothetical protein J7M39_03750 [Anaerolineae bacterium]|nr:hypothetical protein [Anaerolineae bacterium]
MPNHFHAIVVIAPPDVIAGGRPTATSVGAPGGTPHVGTLSVDTDGGAHRAERAGTSPAPTTTAATGPTLGDVVGAFKSITTREYTAGVRTCGWAPFDHRLWQRNYWEHIVRTPESLTMIADYIINNPRTWPRDQLHPDNQGGRR